MNFFFSSHNFVPAMLNVFEFWPSSVIKMKAGKRGDFIRTNESFYTLELQNRNEINYFVNWSVRRITAPIGSLRHSYNQLLRYYLFSTF